jgi:predicted transcriptional regulator of viral defense system
LANRTIVRVSYRFVYAPDQAIWGHSPVWVTPYEQVIVSDLEKTILDGLIRPDLCAGVEQVATGLWMRHDDLDWGKLANYAKRLDRHVVAQRLGYLLELYGLGTPALIESLQALVGTAYARLDPILPDDGPYLARWRLRLNLEPEALQAIIRT